LSLKSKIAVGKRRKKEAFGRAKRSSTPGLAGRQKQKTGKKASTTKKRRPQKGCPRGGIKTKRINGKNRN
jgi:hypothetical protein